MKFAARIVLVGFFCLSLALAATTWIVGPGLWWPDRPSGGSTTPGAIPESESSRQTYPDPNSPGTGARVFVDASLFDADMFVAVIDHTIEIRDPSSLQELHEAIRGRGRRSISELRARYDQLKVGSHPTFDERL
jgi:hypothetical protein